MSSLQPTHRPRAGLTLVALMAFVAYAATLIWQTSFVVDGARTFCLFDDAMISMTYARNLVEGYGLSWSRWDVPVEGFTHPLWTLGMLLPQLSGLSLAHRPLLVQLASLVILVLNLFAVHRVARRHFCTAHPSLAVIPVIATAIYYPLNYWSLVGMESGFQALLVMAGLDLAFDAQAERNGRIIPLCFVAAIGALLRLDMILVGLELGAYVLLTTHPWARRSEWIRGALLGLLMLGAYQVFRVAYYGDWLPNTYYLKMQGGDPLVRMKRGLMVFSEFLLPVSATVGAATLAALWTLRDRPKNILLLCLLYTYFAYSIYVGGDAWEVSFMSGNRFQCFVMPLVPMLFASSLDSLFTHRPRRPGMLALVAIALVFGSDMNGVWHGPNREVRVGYLLLRGRPFGIDVHERVVSDVKTVMKQVPARTRVAVVWAGIPAYFSDFEMVDIMGYNDRAIAKGPWARKVPLERADLYFPGHMKQNLAWTLREKQPKVLFQWWIHWKKPERQMLQDMGYRRVRTGPVIPATAGEMWLKTADFPDFRWPSPQV